MGLDMYLYKRHYLSGYDHSRRYLSDASKKADSLSATDRLRFDRLRKELEAFDAVVKVLDTPASASSPHLEVDVCVAYWRKANSIHNWFVTELADGVDQCQQIYVSRDQLKTLLELCRKTLDELDKTKAIPKWAPQPVSGFFFGNTENVEWYRDDIENTVNQLTEILARDTGESGEQYIYQASW